MRGVDHDATMLVKAVKGKDLPERQYTTVKVAGQWRTIRDANRDDAIAWFAEWAAPIVKAAGIGPKVLVPVPNRSAVVGGHEQPRTTLLAQAITAAIGAGATTADVLRWRKSLAKSTDLASRQPQVLLPDLVLTGPCPLGRVVLVDDVFTSGGHIIASTWRLQDQQRHPVIAVACGRTMHAQAEDPFTLPPEQLVVPPRPA